MMELEINGQKYYLDTEKAKEQADWYERREQHIAWVMSGGMFGKKDKSQK